MTSLDELDERLTVVEEKVAMEARVRAMQDADLSRIELKVDKIMDGLQALSKTSSEHNRKIEGLTAKVDGLTAKVDGLTAKVDGLTTRVDGLTIRVDGHDGVLGRLETGMTAITVMLTHLIERDAGSNGN